MALQELCENSPYNVIKGCFSSLTENLCYKLEVWYLKKRGHLPGRDCLTKILKKHTNDSKIHLNLVNSCFRFTFHIHRIFVKQRDEILARVCVM